MGEKHENTNLASEFYVLSMLYRKGFNASLTLGNKKSVDIIVTQNDKVITIDVKGLLKKSGAFPVENCINRKNHFIIFVCFKDISNHKLLEENPGVWVVPSLDLPKSFKELEDLKSCPSKLVYTNPKGNRHVVDLNRLKRLNERYFGRWDTIVEE